MRLLYTLFITAFISINTLAYLDINSLQEIDAYSDQEVMSSSFKDEPLSYKLEHFVAEGVPEKPLRKTFSYFQKKSHLFKNKNYISVVDFSQSSKNRRWYILNMNTGEVQREFVAHGSGRNRLGIPVSDLNHDGYINRCKHSKFSRRIRLVQHRRYGMTRPGFIRVDGTYRSPKFTYGEYRNNNKNNAILLTGLQKSSADVRRRAVVIHEADYVFNYSRIQGRTLGCLGIPVGRMKHVIDKLKGGSLLFNYVPQCD